MRSWRTVLGIAVATLVLLVPVHAKGGTAAPMQTWGPGSTHIQHVITVVMENRGYDNFFGSYCLALGPYCSSTGSGIPSGTCVPYDPSNPALGCVTPYNLTTSQFVTSDMQHDLVSGRASWNNGAMNGFYGAEYSGSLPFGHYNGSTLPIYWDMAEQYATSDNLFAGNLSWSLPNHWYLMAGAVPHVTQFSYLDSAVARQSYLNQSNHTKTIQDTLNGSSTSWKYYDWKLAPYARAINNMNFVGAASAFDYWNPLAARAESYQSYYNQHFAARGDFVKDLKNGTLPQISWLIPLFSFSDHAPANVTMGESWVAQLVNAVEASPEWNSTAIFVIWDDYGGYYDHVAPPRVHANLLSFRSPILVISPYARENYISHVQLSFFSLLHFVEWRFKLGCLTRLDCAAPLPFDFFNFNQSARPPMYFATDWTKASYPMPLQAGGNAPCAGCLDPTPSYWAPNDTAPTPAQAD
jgi:phospholipase C